MKDSYIFYADQLSEEYRKVFEQVDMYIGTEGIDALTREEQMNQLLDIFLSAQKAGKPVEKVVGKNLEAFCQAFCADFGWRNRLLSVLDALKSLAWLIVVFSALDLLDQDWSAVGTAFSDLWNAFRSVTFSSSVGGMAAGLVISELAGLLSSLLVRRFMFHSKRVSMTLLKAITWGTAVISFAAVLILLDSQIVNVIHCPVWIALLAACLYLIMYYICGRKRLQRQKRGKVRFSDLVTKEVGSLTPELMANRFQKLNARLAKRGKEPMSMEAFLEKEEKNCRFEERFGPLFHYLFPPVITAIAALFTDFPSLFDAVLFTALLLAVTYPIMLWFWNITKKDIAERKAWILKKRQERDTAPGNL